jgi:hypothetical protein
MTPERRAKGCPGADAYDCRRCGAQRRRLLISRAMRDTPPPLLQPPPPLAPAVDSQHMKVSTMQYDNVFYAVRCSKNLFTIKHTMQYDAARICLR